MASNSDFSSETNVAMSTPKLDSNAVCSIPVTENNGLVVIKNNKFYINTFYALCI